MDYLNYESIRSFSKTKWGWIISFLWAFAEGIIFFIVPDVYIGFITVFSVSAGFMAVTASVLGSLTSAMVIFSLNAEILERLNAFIVNLPGISVEMVQKVVLQLQTNGLVSLINAPLSGIPYKIYSINAALAHFPLIQYLLWSIPSRLERILPIVIFSGILGYFFRGSIKKHAKFWVAGYVLIWAMIYLAYYFKVGF